MSRNSVLLSVRNFGSLWELTVDYFWGHESLSLAVFNGIVLWGAGDQTGTEYCVPLALNSEVWPLLAFFEIGNGQDQDAEETETVFEQAGDEVNSDSGEDRQISVEVHEHEGQGPGRFPCPEVGQALDGKDGCHLGAGDAENRFPEAEVLKAEAVTVEEGQEKGVE